VACKLIDLLMNRLEKMRWLEKVGYTIEGLVVNEDSPQQRLLRLDIVRGRAVERSRFFDLLACCRISEGHGVSCLPGNCGIARRLRRERAACAVVPQFTLITSRQ